MTRVRTVDKAAVGGSYTVAERIGAMLHLSLSCTLGMEAMVATTSETTANVERKRGSRQRNKALDANSVPQPASALVRESEQMSTNPSPSPVVEKDLAQANDAELLRLVQSGDSSAATELYGRYASRLRALAHSRTPSELKPVIESVDIVQSAMGSFFRRASQGDYDLPDGLELWSLLLVITLNKIKDAGAFHRSRKRDARRTTRLEPTAWNHLALCDPKGDTAQLRLMIDELLGSLEEDPKRMIELRIAGFSVDEIAAETGRAKRTIERVLQNVRARFQRVLMDPA